MKLSIIVPAYNSAGFLRETLDSLLAQAAEAEILVIDDGSTDETGAIADAYAAAHSCLRVIHQENAGVSAARNRGIDAAQGDYLLFLDSDDLFAPGSLQAILAGMAQTDADLGVFEISRFGFGGTEPNPIAAALARENEIDPWDYRLLWNFLLGNKCFRTASVRAHGIRFPSTRYSEDGVFLMTFIFAASPRITGITGAVYQYRRREPGDGCSVTQTVSLPLLQDFCTSLQLIRTAADTALAAPCCGCGDPAAYRQELLFKEHYTIMNEFYRLLWAADDETLGMICARCAALAAQMTPDTLRRAQTAQPDLGQPHASRAEAANHPRISVLLPHGANARFYASLYSQSMPLFEALTPDASQAPTAENLRLCSGNLRKAARGAIRLRYRGTGLLDPRELRVVMLLKMNSLGRFLPDRLCQLAAPLLLRLKDLQLQRQQEVRR